MINRHPMVSLLWEADVLRFCSNRCTPETARRLEIWNACFSRHGLDPAAFRQNWQSRKEFARCLYEAAATERTRVIGEKSPYYADILPRLVGEFPEARIVCLHRDPGALMASVRDAAKGNRFFSRPWMPMRVLKDSGRLRRDALRLACTNPNLLSISYEELVHSPGETCGRIWRLCGLPAAVVSGDEPETKEILLPPGEHHRRAKEDAPTGSPRLIPCHSPLLEIHRDYRTTGRAGSLARRAVLLGTEVGYHGVRARESLVRLAFRTLPVDALQHHRRTLPLLAGEKN